MGERLAYPVPEAAALLGCGRSKFYELIAEGRIETVTIGRRRVVPHDALVAFLDQLRAGEAA